MRSRSRGAFRSTRLSLVVPGHNLSTFNHRYVLFSKNFESLLSNMQSQAVQVGIRIIELISMGLIGVKATDR